MPRRLLVSVVACALAGLLAALALPIGLGPREAAAEAPSGKVNLTFADATGGNPVPVRVELVDAGGASFIADDAIPVGSDCNVKDVAWKDGLEAAAYNARGVSNPFTGQKDFYSAGTSSLALPPGRYRILAWKGIEYLASSAEVVVEAGRTTDVTVKMSRWIDMTRAGWHGADGHLHIARSSPARNMPLSRWMQAEDLQFVNLLQWGNARGFVSAMQYAHGPGGVYQNGDFFLAAGQENPRTHILGHTLIWGAASAIDVKDAYVVYKRFWDEARRQGSGAVMGYAHGGLQAGAQNGLAVDLPQNTLDFIEVLQGGLHHEVWYNVLNTGFRLAPVAGTDYPCGAAFPGRDRFYTEIVGPVSYQSWLAGIRKGRTFVTNGPLLELRVGDQGMGGEVTLKKPGPVAIRARVRFDPARDDVAELALIENGRVVHTVARPEKAAEIRLEIARPIHEAAWLAILATGTKVGETRPGRSLAHSAPVYVTLKGAPSLAEHPRARALAGAWLARLLELKARTGTQADHISLADWQDDVPPADLKKNRAELFEVIAAAQKHFADQAR